ncbi:MAG: GNAT family N-acetyltransferase [Anaerolineales bacterium]
MEIVTASLMDLNALRHLEKVCFPKDAWPLLDLIAVLTYPGITRLKMVENGHMLGFVAGDPRPQEQMGWIATIGVLPQHRRRGIGEALLAACEEGMGLPRVRLSVRAENESAIQMYKKNGYRVVDMWSNYYNDGGSAIIMEKIR